MKSPGYLADIKTKLLLDKLSPKVVGKGHPVLLSSSPTTIPKNLRPKVNHTNNINILRSSYPSNAPKRESKEVIRQQRAETLNINAVSYANLSSLASEKSEMYSPQLDIHRFNQKLFPLRKNMKPVGIMQSQSKQHLHEANGLFIDQPLPYIGSLPSLHPRGKGEYTLVNSQVQSQCS